MNTVVRFEHYRRYLTYLEHERSCGMLKHISFASFVELATKDPSIIDRGDDVWSINDFAEEITSVLVAISKQKSKWRIKRFLTKKGETLEREAFRFFRTTVTVDTMILAANYYMFGKYCKKMAELGKCVESFATYCRYQYDNNNKTIIHTWTEGFTTNNSYLPLTRKANRALPNQSTKALNGLKYAQLP